MPAGDVFGLDGIFLTKSNPVVVSTIGINSTAAGAGITATAGSFSAGTVTLTLSTAAGLSTTPFYTGAKIAVSGLTSTTGVAFTGYNGTFNVTGFAGTTTVSYATTGYVGSVTAGITTTGLVMLVTDTQVTNTTWSSAQTHGWFGGGTTPTISTVDRIDFSNDTGTANIRGPLSSARYALAATGNSNYGWFGGGQVPAPVSTVDRIDFSNDSATASVRGPLSVAKHSIGATGNSNYGWFAGGFSTLFPVATRTLSMVDRIDFSNDSTTTIQRGQLFERRHNSSATANSNYGFVCGGVDPQLSPALSSVNRIDFSNDSATPSPRGPLSSTRYGLAATGNSNYGWFGSGRNPLTGTIWTSLVDRIDFSNDLAVATPRGLLTVNKVNLSATGNSNYGWFGGGSPLVSTVDRIDFSNDLATASIRGPLSSARGYVAATSGQARSSSVRLQKGGNFGWFGGGGSTGSVLVDRIDFSNDSSTALPRGPLTSVRTRLAATGNSNYGWFGGGFGPLSSVNRIDFSNDSSTTSVRGVLSAGRYFLAATGNSNYGWFAGGTTSTPTPISTVDRIDFSNDLATASPRSPLIPASGKDGLAATGNSNYGWFGGGTTAGGGSGTVTVDRIDFSNDNVQLSPRGPLSLARKVLSATGNSNYGWFGGGNILGSPVSTVDRINFSNDLATLLQRGAINSPGGRRNAAAAGNSNYGWFGGGNILASPAITATVDRIDFSNDLVATSPRSPLSSARYDLAATSNTPI